EVGRLARRYKERHGIDLDVSPAARRALVAAGFSAEYGARHLVSHIDRVCNVDVGLRLREHKAPAFETGRVLLERIRSGREGGRAIDEAAVRMEVARETCALPAGGGVIVDWDGRQ